MPSQYANFPICSNGSGKMSHLEVVGATRQTGGRDCRQVQGTANRDPTSQCDTHQSHLLSREEEILWQRKLNHLQRPSQSKEEWIPVKHVLISRIPSRMSTGSLVSSYSESVTGSNFRRSDALKRWRRLMILTTIYITGCWGTLPRIVTSLKM